MLLQVVHLPLVTALLTFELQSILFKICTPDIPDQKGLANKRDRQGLRDQNLKTEPETSVIVSV